MPLGFEREVFDAAYRIGSFSLNGVVCSCLIGPNGEEILRGGRQAQLLTASIDCSRGLEGMRQSKYLDHLRTDIVFNEA